MSIDALDLFAASISRLRYPTLAAALAGPERPGAERAVSLLLGDIANARTPAESLAAMIHDGQFDAVEGILLELLESLGATPLGEDELARLMTDLDVTRAAAVADVGLAWATLEERAAALGLPREDGDEVLRLAGVSRPDAEERIAARTDQIGAELERRLQSDLGSATPGPDAESWHEAVRRSVDLGEFGMATDLLNSGAAAGVGGHSPITVPPMIWRWPWAGRPVAEVLEWYGDRVAPPDAEFGRYRPAPDDAEAQRLIVAVGAVVLRTDRDTVAELGAALAAAVGGRAAEAYPDGDGFAVTLDVTDPRLASLALFTDRLSLWAGATAPPPGNRPVVWFRPVMQEESPADPGLAVLDVSTLLRLIAPVHTARPVEPDTRRINLLRRLIPQLDPAALLASGVSFDGAAPARETLAWLIDAFGMVPEAAVLDGLLQDFGLHPAAHGRAVRSLIASGRSTESGRRITADDLRAVRTSTRAEIRAAVLAPLAANPLVRATLWLTLQHLAVESACAADDILDGFRQRNVPSRVAARMISRTAITEALETLTAQGLLRRRDRGYGSAAPGLVAALLDPAEMPAERRIDAVFEELSIEAQTADDAAAAVLGPRVAHLIGHRVDNDVLSVIARLQRIAAQVDNPPARTALTELEERIRALGGGTYVQLYYEALSPPEPVEVTGLVTRLIGSVEWHLPAGLNIEQPLGEACWVRINPTILLESLRNLVLNSARALARLDGTERRGIQIAVTTQPETADRPVPVTGPCVVIEVADSGLGFSAEELARARALTEPTGALWRPAAALDGARQGLPMSASLLWEYGGRLEVRNGSAIWSGGCVRAWLPQSTDHTRP
ncbi:hypothetical protein ACFPIJ_13525 [Dactylosporangium cerinum]|uniref:Uncharacterized protein n=1 Tax=Dactylosporangium cerinum TaxID=1434730 RepID=A0ABV9VS57_9ACTN